MKPMITMMLLLAACGGSDGSVGLGDPQRGERGPAGPVGPVGPAGPQGPAGVSAPGADDPSGSRLKALYFNGADGSRVQVASFFDSLRGEKCSSALDVNGVGRCMPLVGAAVAGIYFADAACTQDVAVVGASCAAPKYAFVNSGTCGAAFRIFSVGGPHAGQAWAKSGASCLLAAVGAGATLYDVSAEVDSTSFVEMSEGM